MNTTVAGETFESLTAFYADTSSGLNWNPLFITPAWLETWWNAFGENDRLSILSVRQDSRIIGIAPLRVRDTEARFIGSSDVCDYLDFVLVPGKEQDFYTTLLDHLKENGITSLNLESMRPDSNALSFLPDLVLTRGCEVSFSPNDVSVAMDLPENWDDYLNALNTKQRHEVRRKLRRLEEAGEVDYRCIGNPDEIREAFDTFLKFFTESRMDKADFLTGSRESFFRAMANTMSEAGIFKLGMLSLNSSLVAMIMYFDYGDGSYLYNSGYDKEYTSLSVGLLSKILCIKESIESGKKVFDFLKGNEVYKSRLGGKEFRLSDCSITIK